MKKKKASTPIYNVIDVKESGEPVTVQIDAETLDKKQSKKPSGKTIAQQIAEEEKTARKLERKNEIKQLVMTGVLGISSERDENIGKRQRFFKMLFTVLFIVFVVAVLIFTFYNDFFAGEKTFPTWDELKGIFGSSWYFLVFALIALFMCFVAKGTKLSILCHSMTGKWNYKTCFETGIIGHYFNNITPLAVGGQPFEIYHLSKHGVHGGVATSLPVATYILNQLAFIILVICALILFATNALGIPTEFISRVPAALTVIAIIGLSFCILMPSLVMIFCIFPRLGASIVKLVMKIGGKLRIVKKPEETTYNTIKTVVQNANCLKTIAKRPGAFLSCFALSFLEHLSHSSIAYFTLKFFAFNWSQSMSLEWMQVVQICLILYIAISFVPTPGNSGAADLSFYLLFEAGLKSGLAFPAMVIWRFLSYYSFIIVGFTFNSLKKKADKKRLSKPIEIK